MRDRLLKVAIGFCLLGLGLPLLRGMAQAPDNTPCGVVQSIDFPADHRATGPEAFGAFQARWGGTHVAADIAEGQWQAPVYAAARGRVTLSDPQAWGVDKGVVAIEHTFPDGQVRYSLYGHLEENTEVTFPSVNACVEQGTVLGLVGWPASGDKPHLHYEIRDTAPTANPPTYIQGNPLTQGWYHPLDFTALWQLRLSGQLSGMAMLSAIPSQPPVPLPQGGYAVASEGVISANGPSGQLWRVEADSPVVALTVLGNGQVAAHTRSGQVVLIENGRYVALWNHPVTAGVPFVRLGHDTLVFPLTGGGLRAYDPQGNILWGHQAGEAGVNTLALHVNGEDVLLVTGNAQAVTGYLFNAQGEYQTQFRFESLPLLIPLPGAGWLAVTGDQVRQLQAEGAQTLTELPLRAGILSGGVTDDHTNSYLYLGDEAQTLLALDAEGQARWEIAYTGTVNDAPPLLQTHGLCLLYALDEDGLLQFYDAASGEALKSMQLYAGDSRRNPQSRLIMPYAGGMVLVNTGFLSLVQLDAPALTDAQVAQCLTG